MVETFDEKFRKTLMVSEYYNNDTEMPHIPDVGILHCGELPHHRMGIKVCAVEIILDESIALIVILISS